MNKPHILVVDDDNRIRELLSKYLQKSDFIVTTASDTNEARKALKFIRFDLVVLDIMMPGENGQVFAKSLRETSNIAILMLTALGDTVNRIAGLEAGADDYLPKPFDPKELLLRINKLLQRTKKNYSYNIKDLLYIGEILFDSKQNALYKNGELITLSTGEAKLLNFLLSNKNQIISRNALAEFMGDINPRSVDVQITRLRNKIEPHPKKPVTLQSIRNKGYILYAE